MPPKGQQNKGKAKAKPKAKPKEVSKPAQSGPARRFTRQQQQISGRLSMPFKRIALTLAEDPEDIEDDPPQAVRLDPVLVQESLVSPLTPCRPLKNLLAFKASEGMVETLSLGELIVHRSLHSMKIQLFPKSSPLQELRKFQLVGPLLVQALDSPLMPAFDRPPVPALASLPEKSARVLLLFVLVAQKNTTKYPIKEVKCQLLDPLLVPPLIVRGVLASSIPMKLPMRAPPLMNITGLKVTVNSGTASTPLVMKKTRVMMPTASTTV
ncbi:hypothetical protein PM082_020715 [Marasmius tenuissimus]|nr:hypothetical protein PM082_020715 [Marasmius tenuissimus]